MASERKQRLRAVDDLRDMAEAIEAAADLFEEAMGDLDAAGPVKKTGKNLPYETLQERLGVYAMLLPTQMRQMADAHLGLEHDGVPEHDPETCAVCIGKYRPEKGWLMTAYRKGVVKEIRYLLKQGDPELTALVTQEAEDHAALAERRALYAALERIDPALIEQVREARRAVIA